MLAVDERHGTLSQTRRLAFALAGAELVDLAQARRIVATLDARVKVTESLGTGDPVLDATLGVLSSSDDGLPLEDVVAIHLPGRVARQATALLGSSELSGREMTTNLGGQPIYSGLRLTDPARRRELIKRLADVAEGEAGLTLEAFGALAHIAGLSSTALRRGHRRARRRLENLADRFGDTWRYLPGCPSEYVLDQDDLAPGQVHPMQEQPWRLAILLAVQEAGRRAAALPRPPHPRRPVKTRDHPLPQTLHSPRNLPRTHNRPTSTDTPNTTTPPDHLTSIGASLAERGPNEEPVRSGAKHRLRRQGRPRTATPQRSGTTWRRLASRRTVPKRRT